MGFYGADVEELRQLAKSFADAGSRLTEAQSAVTTQVRSSPWRGPDADDFRHAWAGMHVGRLLAAAAALQQNSEALVKNADDQDSASTDTGAAGGVAAGGTAGAGARSGQRPPADSPAEDVLDWWNGLTPAEQQAAIAADPGAIGGLDGIPAAVRDEANRLFLESELDRLRSSPVPGDPAAAGDRQRAIDVLENAQDVLETTPDATLLLLDTHSGDTVKVAIGLGDVDTADDVAVYTQGMNSRADVDGGLSGPVDDLADLRDAAKTIKGDAGDTSTTAMVVWMGYDSPQLAEVADPSYGKAGGADLADFAEGIRANNPDGHLTALGHSYGSYTTGVAVQQTDAFDDVVFFGSPGIGTGDLDDLRVSSGEAYVLEADYDGVADLGYFGPDPNQIDGVTNLSTDARPGLEGVTLHNSYLDPRTVSQYNMAAVLAGHPDLAVQGDKSGFGDDIQRGLDWLFG
jgi:hypothetical protein